MEQNIGTIDRTLRAIAGVMIIAAGLYAQNWWGLLGILPIIAAIVGYCPPYAWMGINTGKQTSNTKDQTSNKEGTSCCPTR
jgi:hypothetical protein